MYFYKDLDLKQDRNTGLKFGLNGHIVVIGHDGGDSRKRRHYFQCAICSQDQELNGDGIFKSFLSNVKNGSIPCNCSSKRMLTKEQYVILCKRHILTKGYEFVGLSEDFENTKSLVRIKCHAHGEFQTKLKQVLNGKFGCLKCRADNRTKDIEIHAKEIKSLNIFAEGTSFEVDTEASEGKPSQYKYLKVYCPTCEVTYSALLNSLKKGKRGCNCSRDIRDAYINIITQEDSIVAIKFGIARDSLKRVRQISNKTNLKIQLERVFRFENSYACSAAESECKRTLDCKVISSKDMKDGYTETTGFENYQKIVEIYQKYGGIDISKDVSDSVTTAINKDLKIAKNKLDRLCKNCDYVLIKARLVEISANPILQIE